MNGLSQYRCHKQVHAAIISAIEIGIADDVLKFEGGGAVMVSKEWVEKHCPTIGGYYVMYEDGYQSFSPASAFDAGYSKI